MPSNTERCKHKAQALQALGPLYEGPHSYTDINCNCPWLARAKLTCTSQLLHMALYEAGLCLLKLLYVPHHRSAECWNLYQYMLQNQTDICNMEVQLGLGWLFSPPSVVVFALQFQVFFTLQQDNEAYAQHTSSNALQTHSTQNFKNYRFPSLDSVFTMGWREVHFMAKVVPSRTSSMLCNGCLFCSSTFMSVLPNVT